MDRGQAQGPLTIGVGTGKVRALRRGSGCREVLTLCRRLRGPRLLPLLRRGEAVRGARARRRTPLPAAPLSKPRGAAPPAQPSPCPPRLARAKGWPRRRARVMARAAFTQAAGPAAGERG